MIDQDRFKTEWVILGERFRRDHSDPVMARYFQYLNDRLDTEQFCMACRKLFNTKEFFPTPEDFVRCVVGSEESLALEQWDLCQRIMEGERHILDRMSPAGKRAVSLLGGVGRLGQTKISEVQFVRKDFLKFFADTVDSDPSTLLPEVTDESRRIVGEVVNGGRLLNPGNQEDT